jgi:hypothetical protein
MKIPTGLRTAAQIAIGIIALAAIVATPTAQPAFADGQPPAPTTPVPHPPTGPLRHAAPDPMVYKKGSSPLDKTGHFFTWFEVKNGGLALSKPILVYTYCTYMNEGNFVVVAASPVKMLPPMTPKAIPTNLTVDCGKYDGLTPIRARAMIVSEDDENSNNNEAYGQPLV